MGVWMAMGGIVAKVSCSASRVGGRVHRLGRVGRETPRPGCPLGPQALLFEAGRSHAFARTKTERPSAQAAPRGNPTAAPDVAASGGKSGSCGIAALRVSGASSSVAQALPAAPPVGLAQPAVVEPVPPVP